MKAVIFDLDGTLLYTLEDLYLSVNEAMKKFNYPLRTIDEVKSFVGDGVRRLIERAIPENGDIEGCLKYFKEYYSLHSQDNTKEYEGITWLLTELNKMNIKCAIVSNKFDGATKELSEKFFGSLISCAIGERENVRKKPYPDTVFEVLNTLNISNKDTIYVGDSDTDIKTAKNAGMECISVLWGYRDKEFLTKNGATNTVSSPEEIIKYVKATKL